MQVLFACRDIDDVFGIHLNGFFAPFLKISSAGDTDKNLPSAGSGLADVPVVPASGLKGDVGDAGLASG